MQVSEFENLSTIVKNFEPYEQLWATAAKWVASYASWHEDPFVRLNAAEMEATIKDARRTMYAAPCVCGVCVCVCVCVCWG